MSMLPQEYTLPRSQCATPVCYGQSQVGACEHAPNMSRHIIRALCRVSENWVSVRHFALHEGFHIPEYIRIRIFTKHQRCAGVLDEYMAEAGTNAGLIDNGLYLAIDIGYTATGRLDVELLLADHSAGTGTGNRT
jgi:hypothetical protein